MLILSEIWIYPIKSLGGIAMPEAVVQRRGLQYDRRWMLTDAQGNFFTQREIPGMALLGTALTPPFLTVFLKKNPTRQIRIPLEPPVDRMEKIRVQVFGQNCAARRYEAAVNAWFSEVLEQQVQLVFMPDTTRRATDGRYAPKGHYVSFADGFPFLVIGQASLDDLNSRLAQPLPMNRFRPNFVITGSMPYEEDEWQQFSIGHQHFLGVKPCGRCIITTTDQETAIRAAEPLKTLTRYRRVGNKILFGQNVVWLAAPLPAGEEKAKVRVGDVILR